MLKRTLPVLLLVGAMALTGCTRMVKKSEVEQQISDSLTQQVGTRPEQITCPGDLKGEVGEKMTCQLTHQGTTLDVYVTVTEVDGNNVKFDIKVQEL